MRILYLTHDLSDPAVAKRIAMLVAGGATVHVAGFRRDAAAVTRVAGCATSDFGQTHNGRFLQRIAAVIREVICLRRHRQLFVQADVILARNLEMLAIGVRGRSLCTTPPALVYESLDIHRLLLRRDPLGASLRWLEGWLSRRASMLITSSPAFIRDYFEKRSRVRLPITLLENKVFLPEGCSPPAISTRPASPQWRIGWFGVIRCRQSLDILCAVARANPELVEIIIRGRPAHDQFNDFTAQVNATSGVSFAGSYTAEDLATIYREVHFSWAIDMFEEGLNSSWLLPNRIYEGGLYGAVPLAAQGVETSRFIQQLGIGHTLDEPKEAALTDFLRGLTVESYQAMQSACAAVPRERWLCSREACEQLVASLRSFITSNQVQRIDQSDPQRASEPTVTDWRRAEPALVVIPCLNEAATLEPLVDYLLAESQTCPMRIVIADGGSTDGTVEIAQRLAAQHACVHYLHNPKRIQSAAINLAVATHGDGLDYLIRLDAHAHYPVGFCHILRDEAQALQADSVVVAMRTVGKTGFQEAVAAAQNSRLGTGGAAHRRAMVHGQWVDHGHHALMRIAAFRAVGGYDERFSHNEDAELDIRLRRAGFRLWLTAQTTLDYFPRASALALFAQYRAYGRGRLRNLLKHHERPKLRQILPVAVVPAAILLLLSPLSWLAALPFTAWALLCLAYGGWIAYRAKRPFLTLSGPAAMLMHGGWSLGFWQGLLHSLQEKRA